MYNPTSVTWPFLSKSRKMSQDRTVELKMAMAAPESDLEYEYIVRRQALGQRRKTVSPQAQKMSLMVALTTARTMNE